MKTLIQRLKERKSQLDQSSFHALLKDSSLAPQDRIAFVPHMLFFVMGFRDMLRSLEDTSSNDPLQEIVNVHCEEDSTHWRWYLHDVKLLISRSLVDPKALDPEVIWSEENWQIRNTVYETIRQCKEYDSPLMRLTVIQVLEATFDSFNDCICHPVNDLEMRDELAYFGRMHLDAEEDHSFEDWLLVDEETYGQELEASKAEINQGRFVIDSLFDAFDDMFENWCQKGESSLSKISVAS
ncbi:MAG: hypothetical protein ACFB10_15795 [Salibacteraceae bacterium]